MKRYGWKAALVLAVALFGVMSCDTAQVAAETGADAVKLVTYDVPEGYESQIRNTIAQVLGRNEQAIGRAYLGPDGKLVVVAPPGIHDGIREFIGEMAKVERRPKQPVPVTVRYWLVVGRPLDAARAATASDGYVVSGSSDLSAIAVPLQHIAASQGAMEFALFEKLDLTSMGDNQSASAAGNRARVQQRILAGPDDTVADISISSGANNIATKVLLRPEQTIVLGQSGYGGKVGDVFDDGTGPLTLFYIVLSDLEA